LISSTEYLVKQPTTRKRHFQEVYNVKRNKIFPSLLLATTLFLFAFATPVGADEKDNDNHFERSEFGCVIQFTPPELQLEEKTKYAEAGYTFDEKCQPILESTLYLDYIPPEKTASISSDATDGIEYSITESSTTAENSALGGNAITATNICHVKTWETDPVYLPVVEVRNDTTYTWNGSAVTYWRVSGWTIQHFSWWFTYGLSTAGNWNPYPTNVWTRVNFLFYCNGGPFCQGGPMYYITLYARAYVNKSGGCSGTGTYSGTLCRLNGLNCKMFYSVWKD